LQWNLDYEKVLKRGFKGIKREAEEKMAGLDPFDPQHTLGKRAFLQAVIIACNAVINFAKRHAKLAREMAMAEKNDQRKKELLEIAAVCEWVPENPARTFREAVQAQWFAQICSRFEQFHGGTIGNGRIDQYLYPFYKKDIEERRLTDEDVLEVLENLWLNMAQNVTFRQSGTVAHWEGVPHFEATTIGGQTRDGQDATNDLSFLIIQSKKEFPLDFPDLAARIHARTPEKFLMKICDLIKEGTGFPKLINDEEVVLSLVAKGGTLEEARDYAISGCTETRMINRDIYMTGNFMVNFGAAVEMALNDGRIRSKNNERLGVSTGNPRKYDSFDQVMTSFKLQLENLARHAFVGNQIADSIRPNLLAAPLQSSLHDLCMKNCVDVHQGKMDGAVILGSWDPIGFGTAVDSLVAIKKLVYDDKLVSMDEMIEALENNFEGKEVIRQRCLNAPKYGNNDLYADSIGREIEDFARSISHRYTTLNGGKLDVRFVPITSHVPLGKIVWATPNGRKAKEPLSEGISPTQGADHKGPTATLISIARTKESKYIDGAARLLNLKLTPSAVDGDLGTKRLSSLIRTWCDLKLWHIQFNIINAETLKAAQKNPEKYTNLLVRVAGYSAYFVDLSLDLQNEIIWRTEHNFVS
jgi:formate C-acetyltransferase